MNDDTTEKRERVNRQIRGVRLSGHLTVQATKALREMQEYYGSRAYDLMSTAIIFYNRAMKGEMPLGGHVMGRPGASTYVGTPVAKRAPSQNTLALNAAKAIWCEECGGEVIGDMCNYNKYEISLSGTTEKMPRTVLLKELPDVKEDFFKNILGAYSNVEEAEKAYKANK